MEKVELDGVPATLLLTLYYRATEARHPHTVLTDPKAVQTLESLDYPFAEKFGRPRTGQFVALRAVAFDRAVREFLAAHPAGTVVSLGEGLETEFWRVDNGRVHWLTVDLPEVIALRDKVLPVESERQRHLACSALDLAWLDEVDPAHGVLVIAQGLLSYFRPPEVRGLLSACAERFPGGAIVFDTISRRVSTWMANGWNLSGRRMVMPEFPWTVEDHDQQRLATAHPNIVEVRDLPLPAGHGLTGRWLLPAAHRLAPGRRPAMVSQLRFGRDPDGQLPPLP